MDPATIYDVVLVGNSTMRDLFFRQSVYSIGQNPYRSITEIEMSEGKRTTTSLLTTGRRSLLPIHPNARVYGLPIISGHVGADAAACMLAVESRARGPAGRHHGHRDEHGAHRRQPRTDSRRIVSGRAGVRRGRHRVRDAWTRRGNRGCLDRAMTERFGSASSVTCRQRASADRDWSTCSASCLAPERMNMMGRFEDGLERVTLDADRRIYFLEQDVNELAQAKGANIAGLRVVFSDYGIRVRRCGRVLPGGRVRQASEEEARQSGSASSLTSPTTRSFKSATLLWKEPPSHSYPAPSVEELESLVKKVEHRRLEATQTSSISLSTAVSSDRPSLKLR